MSKDPAVLFYTGDFLNGCIDLTIEERGQYITMLCLQHQKGHLSEKTIRLSVGSVSVDVMDKFIKDEKGFFFNERMENEINKRSNYIESRTNNGKQGGRPKKESKPYVKPYGKANDNHSENENENRDKKVPFETFWNLYDKKVDRIKCEPKWNRLELSEQNECIKKLPEYIKSTPDKKFRRDPETYLNNKSWENEIIKPDFKQPELKPEKINYL